MPVPRSTAAADMVRAVVADCSMYGRKLKEYRPCSSSGISHQACGGDHRGAPFQAQPDPLPAVWSGKRCTGRAAAGPRGWRPRSRPPIAAIATPDLAAARPGLLRPRTADTSGSTAHGATRPGSAAAEVDPIRMVNVGHSAKTAPASSRELSLPISSARASLTRPANPTVTSRASQSRSDQPDRHVQQLASQEKRRHRDGVADVLVLQAAEPLVRIPQRPEPLQKLAGVEVHAELGVEDYPAGVGARRRPSARPAARSGTTSGRRSFAWRSRGGGPAALPILRIGGVVAATSTAAGRAAQRERAPPAAAVAESDRGRPSSCGPPRDHQQSSR